MVRQLGKTALSRVDYLLVFTILLLRISPFFSSYRWSSLLVFILTAGYFFYRKMRISSDPILLGVFILYTFLSFVQGVIWSFSLLSLVTSFAFVFLTTYYLFRIYGFNLFLIFEQIVYRLALFSILIYLSHELIPAFERALVSLIELLHPYSSDSSIDDNMMRSAVIYTYMPEFLTSSGQVRNAGFSHEPGGFVTFIFLAWIIQYLRDESIFNFRSIVYLSCVLTSYSTAGYLSLALFVLLISLSSGRSYLGLVMIPVLVLAGFRIYNEIDFIGQKIENQVTMQSASALNEETTGRIYGARKSWNVLSKYPLYGRGLLHVSRPKYSDHPEYAAYGWLSEVARYGIIFGGLWLYLFVKGIYNLVYPLKKSFFEFVIVSGIILLNLFSQSLITVPFFFVFFYSGIYNYKAKT